MVYFADTYAPLALNGLNTAISPDNKMYSEGQYFMVLIWFLISIYWKLRPKIHGMCYITMICIAEHVPHYYETNANVDFSETKIKHISTRYPCTKLDFIYVFMRYL